MAAQLELEALIPLRIPIIAGVNDFPIAPSDNGTRKTGGNGAYHASKFNDLLEVLEQQILARFVGPYGLAGLAGFVDFSPASVGASGVDVIYREGFISELHYSNDDVKLLTYTDGRLTEIMYTPETGDPTTTSIIYNQDGTVGSVTTV